MSREADAHAYIDNSMHGRSARRERRVRISAPPTLPAMHEQCRARPARQVFTSPVPDVTGSEDHTASALPAVCPPPPIAPPSIVSTSRSLEHAQPHASVVPYLSLDPLPIDLQDLCKELHCKGRAGEGTQASEQA